MLYQQRVPEVEDYQQHARVTVNYAQGTLRLLTPVTLVVVDEPGYLSSIDRIDYSNDTATALSKGQLTRSKWAVGGGVSNDSFAYFGGGSAGGPSPWNLISNVLSII